MGQNVIEEIELSKDGVWQIMQKAGLGRTHDLEDMVQYFDEAVNFSTFYFFVQARAQQGERSFERDCLVFLAELQQDVDLPERDLYDLAHDIANDFLFNERVVTDDLKALNRTLEIGMDGLVDIIEDIERRGAPFPKVLSDALSLQALTDMISENVDFRGRRVLKPAYRDLLLAMTNDEECSLEPLSVQISAYVTPEYAH